MIATTEPDEPPGSPTPGPEIATARLRLRVPGEHDIAGLVRLAGDRRIARMLASMPHPYGTAEARAFIARARSGEGGRHFAVVGRTDGALIGGAGLMTREGGAELGYWIGVPCQGQGFATEAAQALVDHAFGDLGLPNLQAYCRVLNDASRRVLHKCGFQFAGTGMRDTLLSGSVATEHYVLERRIWTGLKTWTGK
jgi:RimJ/RimL family protein N-acetyltransferase